MLNKGLVFSTPPQPTAMPVSDRPAPTIAVLDPRALATLQQLDPTGGSGFLDRVLRTFQASAGRLSGQLAAAREVDDRKSIRLVAHTLKSSATSIGALTLAAICSRIETAVVADAGGDVDMSAQLDAMTAALELTLAAIRQRLDAT